MDNIEVEIRNNLYEFYDLVAQICGIYSEKQDYWSVIRNILNVWPRIIYRVDKELVEQKSAVMFSEKVKSGPYPELDKTLLESLIAQSGFEVYMLKYKGVGVSTVLVFNSETSTGLYFIATQKSAQRQGFARLLVQHIIFQESRKSSNPIILHATQKGEALYPKLGFLPFNQFFLYRYLNTN